MLYPTVHLLGETILKLSKQKKKKTKKKTKLSKQVLSIPTMTFPLKESPFPFLIFLVLLIKKKSKPWYNLSYKANVINFLSNIRYSYDWPTNYIVEGVS